MLGEGLLRASCPPPFRAAFAALRRSNSLPANLSNPIAARLGFSPSTPGKIKGRLIAAYYFGWGRGITPGFLPSAPMGPSPFGRRSNLFLTNLSNPIAARLGFSPSTPGKIKGRLIAAYYFGWGRGIRTPTGGVRVRSPTIRRSPRNPIVRLIGFLASRLYCQSRRGDFE